jgi:hypothetical protein
MALQSASHSPTPLCGTEQGALRPPAMATVTLVPVLGDALPILSQEECLQSALRGRGSATGVGPSSVQRGRRKNLAVNPRAQRGDRHGAHPHDINGRGGDTIPEADVHSGVATGRGGSRSLRGRRRGRLGSRGVPPVARGGRHVGTHRALGLAPPGWIPPPIQNQRLSPIALRARRWVEEVRDVPGVNLGSEGAWDDAANDSAEDDFSTPARTPPREGMQALSPPALCGFSVADFQPGAPPADIASRQSLGEHHPCLHNCGVNNCPFSLTSPASIARARSRGIQLHGTGSPTDHARVDHRAFPDLVQVKVRLSLLGFDRTLWGDLEHFTGKVQHRYYHEVTGQPMFSVNFGGSIGIRELRVTDTLPLAVVQRTLDFGAGEGSGTATEVHTVGGATGDRAPPGNHTKSDTSDAKWVGCYEDFDGVSLSGTSSPHSSAELVPEDALQELGYYEDGEDLS